MARTAFVLIWLIAASPAFAAGSTQVPEGSAATLLALGLIGVIVGRKGSMHTKDRAKDQDRKEP